MRFTSIRWAMTSCMIAACLGTSLTAVQAKPSPPQNTEFLSRDAVTEWMNNYRTRPEPGRLPAAVHRLSESGALREPEAAGFQVGFVAGVLGANPGEAERLIDRMLPLPDAEQWFMVRAIAYSGLPAWQAVLARTADKLPARRGMIDEYLAGKLPTIDAITLDKSPTFLESLGEHFGAKPQRAEISFARNPELLDTLWGQYFATGRYRPLWRIFTILPWSKDRQSVERLTIGSAAKYTLANNAAHYPDVLAKIREMAPHQDAEVKTILAEVARAAETAQTANIRKQQLAAIETFKTKGAGYQRDMKIWGYATEGVIGVGCIVASTMSLTAFGLPCVIGGAATSALLNYWAAQ